MSAESEVIVAEMVEDLQQSTSRALAVRREAVAGLIRPIAKPAEVLAAQNDTRELIQQTLQEDRDYGTIPGTKKPTLYKPGAERVNAAFGCAAQYRIIEKEVDHDRVNRYTKRDWEWHPSIRGKKVYGAEVVAESQGLYRYVLLCQLVHRESGVVIGEGVGSCSTMESKYIDRPRDLENTVLKMAKKRAYVDATLTTFGLSEQFTQDVEDMEHGHDEGDTKETRAFSIDDVLGFGKHKDKTWRQLLESDEWDYVSWAVGNMDKLTEEAKRVLSEALSAHADGPPVRTPAEKVAPQGQPAGSPQRNGNGGANGNGGTHGADPATPKQIELVEQLAKSSALTEDERAGLRGRLLRGMTKKQASEAIEWLNATIRNRKAGDDAAQTNGKGHADKTLAHVASADPDDDLPF